MSFAPLPVPTIPGIESQRDVKLSDDHEKKRVDVLAHFDNPDYRLPKEENGQLMDEEKIWLVSRILYYPNNLILICCIVKRVHSEIPARIQMDRPTCQVSHRGHPPLAARIRFLQRHAGGGKGRA